MVQTYQDKTKFIRERWNFFFQSILDWTTVSLPWDEWEKVVAEDQNSQLGKKNISATGLLSISIF